MPKVSPGQVNFSSGEVSPEFKGRVDNDRYKAGLDTLVGYVPTIQGGLTRIPGTKYVAGTKTNSKSSRLLDFEFSTEQAYILEFGDEYIRFYRNHAQITSGGSPYEITSPYLESELFDIQFIQNGNVMYLVHPNHAPRILTRSSHTNWSLSVLNLVNGPYMPVQTYDHNYNVIDYSLGNVTLTPDATSGTAVTVTPSYVTALTGATDNGSGKVRMTLSSSFPLSNTPIQSDGSIVVANVTGTVEANGTHTDYTIINNTTIDLDSVDFTNGYTAGGVIYNGQFTTDDVDRHLKLRHGSTIGWGKIVSVVSPIEVQVNVIEDFGGTTATADWNIGSYSDRTGYPTCLTFFEDRLSFAGARVTPQRLDMSRSSNYIDFSTEDGSGNVVDSSAIAVTVNANDVNVFEWLATDEKGLLAGTSGGEWVIRSNASYEAVTPTNITAKKATNYGSNNLQPVQAGKSTIYTQRTGKKLREFTYFYEVDGFKSNDLTLLSNHIGGEGFTEFTFQKEPYPIIWGARTDGQLVGVVYERDLDGVRAGWTRRIMGGFGDQAGDHAKVESVAVIPSPDGSSYELWMVVQRYIDGSIVRYVEYIAPYFDDLTDQEDAYFLDCGLSYDDPITISAITKASPGVVTTDETHSIANGSKVLFRKIKGMTELNNQSAYVANATATTFELVDSEGNNISTSSYGAYISSGEVRKFVSSLSGLDHLEGETVSLFVDGATQPDVVVDSGTISLSDPGCTIHVGYNYNSDIKLLRTEAGSNQGFALGKKRRINQLGLLLHRTLGLKYGDSFDNLDELPFRDTNDPLSRAVPLFTGLKSFRPEMDIDYENQLCIRQDKPLPSTILAIVMQLDTMDRG